MEVSGGLVRITIAMMKRPDQKKQGGKNLSRFLSRSLSLLLKEVGTGT